MRDTIFSDTEVKIIEELKKSTGGISAVKLAESVYRDHENPPLNMNNCVLATINQINKKTRHYNLTWFIDGEGLGRKGKLLWLQVRKP